MLMESLITLILFKMMDDRNIDKQMWMDRNREKKLTKRPCNDLASGKTQLILSAVFLKLDI